MQGIFRVEQVLRGDSAEVVVDGVGVGDRRVRIEMSRAEAAGIEQGSLLVVQWWAAQLPVMDAGTPSGTGLPEAELVAEPALEESGRSPAQDEQAEQAEQEFRALLGLD